MEHVPYDHSTNATEPAWKKLAGAGAGRDLMTAFATDKKRERKLEDLRP